jgi:DNA-binding SARP family transcriptional activator
MRGDAQAAAAHARRAIQLAHDTALKFSAAETYALLAHACCELNQPEAALEAAAQAIRTVAAPRGSRLAFDQTLTMAHAWLSSGESAQASTWLTQALELGRERGYVNALFWFQRSMSRLCAYALAHGIETSYVRDLIRRHRLTPEPDVANEHWPWALRIRALGGFEISADESAVTFSGKVPKKPLELLKLLVARGNGGLEGSAIAQQLWPDAQGDDAENVLRMTLHRLRKILGRDEFVLLQDGKVRLNRALCWVDAWHFERECDALRSHDASAHANVEEALRLYHGPAFDGEEPQAWMLASRDRWRGKFVALIKTCGQRLRQSGDARGAAAALQRGIDAEPLSEELYQELMACLLSEGNRAEAYAAYRRCRDTLSITLGLKPSGKTETLRQQAAAEG